MKAMLFGNIQKHGMRAVGLVILLLVALSANADFASDPFTQEWQELAPGVWAGVRPDSPRTPVLGNTTLVVSDEGVVVFDGGGAPLASERVVQKVRELGNAPVTHIVVSHWHGDHDYGIFRILEAFPAAQVISHSYTRANLDRNSLDGSFLDDYIPRLRERIAAGTYSNGDPLSPADIARFQDVIDHAPLIDQQQKTARLTYPNLTFTDSMTLWSGGREIQLLHLGNSNTAGDVVLYLPEEKLLATGDMMVLPTPYGFGSYPRAWADTLRRLKQLEHVALVPGHGPVQRDDAYLDLLIETMDSIASQMTQLVEQGLDEEAAAAQLDFTSLEPRFTEGDAFLGRLFDIWFKTPIAKAAWKEARGESPEIE